VRQIGKTLHEERRRELSTEERINTMCVTWPCTLRALITWGIGWTILRGKTFFRSTDPDCDMPEASDNASSEYSSGYAAT
jgi:hypothetical protein